MLYLGEINDQQQAAWRKTLDLFVEEEQRYAAVSLFPEDREIPADALDSVQVKLSGLELRRPATAGWRVSYGASSGWMSFGHNVYPTQSHGGDGLPAWTKATRPIENTDIVVWYAATGSAQKAFMNWLREIGKREDRGTTMS